MKQELTLIKLNKDKDKDHYIIVDDSEMLPDVFIYDFLQKEIKRHSGNYDHIEYINKNCKKITHSTKPLEPSIRSDKHDNPPEFVLIKPLNLSYCREIDLGYSVELNIKNRISEFSKIAIETKEHFWTGKCAGLGEALQIFRIHKELIKDKLFTVEDMEKAYTHGVAVGNVEVKPDFDEYIQTLLPPTQWKVNFNKQGKLELI